MPLSPSEANRIREKAYLEAHLELIRKIDAYLSSTPPNAMGEFWYDVRNINGTVRSMTIAAYEKVGWVVRIRDDTFVFAPAGAMKG